jgi:hypothetical protein
LHVFNDLLCKTIFQLINLPADKQVMSLEERRNRQRSVTFVLESSLRELDEALMLFHDFEEPSLLKLDDL